jgi:hypothetical protein
MKRIAEYLERAKEFELLATAEADSKLKGRLLQQAQAYRQLAAARARRLGVPLPRLNQTQADQPTGESPTVRKHQGRP